MDNNGNNKDILALCQLNLMEEGVAESPSLFRDATLKVIDWKKRECILRIWADPSPIAPDAEEKHIEADECDLYEISCKERKALETK